MKHKTIQLEILIFLALLFILVKIAPAQGYIGAAGTNRGVNIQTGALIKKQADITIGLNTRVTNDADKPIMAYVAAGKRFCLYEEGENQLHFTPFAGYAVTHFDTLTKDGESKYNQIKKFYWQTEFAYERRNLRWFATVSQSHFLFVGMGVKAFIILRNPDGPVRRRVY